MERVILAYSGGLDMSVAIPWLAEPPARMARRAEKGGEAHRWSA